MASQNSVRRLVLAELSQRGSIRGRNPVGTLCNAIQAEGVEGKRVVEMVVEDLRKEGKVTVPTDGKGRVTGIFHKRPRRHVDRTEMSPQQKREAMYAKGVPALLPDSMCSPVVVTYAPGREQEELAFRRGMKLHERMNICLMALRRAAGDGGVREGVGAKRTVLAQVQSSTEKSVEGVLLYLRCLDLLIDGVTATGMTCVKGVSPVIYSYAVDTDVEEVTPEMAQTAYERVEARRAEKRAKKVPVVEGDAADSIDAPPELQDPYDDAFLELLERIDLESGPNLDVANSVENAAGDTLQSPALDAIDGDTTVVDAMADDDVAARLAEIVVELESALQREQAETARLQGVVGTQQASITELSRRVTAGADTILGLREELAEARKINSHPPNRLVTDILARHQPK